MALSVALAYHNILSYKDVYEVARLFADEAFQRQIDEQFDGVRAMEFYLAPPILSRFFKDKTTGHPRKIRLGGWMLPVFRLLAKGKKLFSGAQARTADDCRLRAVAGRHCWPS